MANTDLTLELEVTWAKGEVAQAEYELGSDSFITTSSTATSSPSTPEKKSLEFVEDEKQHAELPLKRGSRLTRYLFR